MTLARPDASGAAQFTVDELANTLLDKLAERPDLLDDLAARIAIRLTHQTTTTRHESPAQQDSPHVDGAEAQALAEWMTSEHRDRIAGDPLDWAVRIVNAAGKVNAQSIFEWAFSESAETSFWRDTEGAIEPPKNRRSSRAGMFTQMRDEYVSSLVTSDISARIDTVISNVSHNIARYGVREFTQLPINSRKSALGLLRDNTWNPDAVTTVIAYVLAKRSYWRSNTTGIPSPRTFARMRGDWMSAADTYNPRSLPDDKQASVNKLAEGWSWYYGHRVNSDGRKIAITDTTRRRLADCLIGGDSAGPISEPLLEQFIVWVCNPHCASAGYLIAGADFPPLTQVRKGILQMTTKRSPSPARVGAGVADTNSAAAGTLAGAAAVNEI